MTTVSARIESRDFSYISALYHEPMPIDRFYPLGYRVNHHHFVVMSPNKRQATEIAARHCAETWGKPEAIRVYPRTYIREARELVARGQVVEVDR